MKLKIPWRKVAATAWEWARIIWQAKHPTDKPPTPPVVPALVLVAALATLAPPCRAQGPDSINVAGVVERQVQRAPWQALYYTHTAPAVLIRCAPHAQMLRNPRVPYPTRQLERA